MTHGARPSPWFCAAAALLLSGECARADVEPGILVRAVPATMRVTREQAIVGEATSIDLHAARNEWEPFQVAVRAEGAPVTGIDAAVSTLRCAESGHVIEPDNIRLFRQYFLYVVQPTGGISWMPRIEYPGPLLPFDDPYSPGNEAYGAPFNNGRIGSVAKPYLRGREGPCWVFPTGSYTGARDQSWVVQIDRSGTAGEATFRWSNAWEGGFDQKVRVRRWNGRSIPIPRLGTNRRSPPVALAEGVSVWFAAGKTLRFEKGLTFHFKTYRNMNEVIWGDLFVPPGTPPGRYQGEVRVTIAGQDDTVLPLNLTVWDFDLPKERSITTTFAGWMQKGFYSDCAEADWLFELMHHAHRIDNQTIRGHWTGWQKKWGATSWTKFDRAATGRLDGSAYPDGVPMKRFHLGFYGCGNEWNWKGDAEEKIENVRDYGQQFATHLKEKGWFDRAYMYCRDEPSDRHIPGIIRDVKAFIEGDPDWRGKFMATTNPKPGSPLLDWIDIWCLKFHWWTEPKVVEKIRERNGEIWCYVANTPHSPIPTYHVDSLQGYEPRIIKWASWKRGATGFLYWASALDQAYPNPWTTAMNDFDACGDGNLIYYGARNGPMLLDNATPLRPIMGSLPGFRLKQIREGLEDWEYLLLCEKLKGRTFTEALVNEVYRAPGGSYGEYKKPEELDRAWTQDPRKIYEVRERIALAILEAQAGE